MIKSGKDRWDEKKSDIDTGSKILGNCQKKKTKQTAIKYVHAPHPHTYLLIFSRQLINKRSRLMRWPGFVGLKMKWNVQSGVSELPRRQEVFLFLSLLSQAVLGTLQVLDKYLQNK